MKACEHCRVSGRNIDVASDMALEVKQVARYVGLGWVWEGVKGIGLNLPCHRCYIPRVYKIIDIWSQLAWHCASDKSLNLR